MCVRVYVVVYMASWETPEPYGDLSRKIADDNPKKVASPSMPLVSPRERHQVPSHNTPDFYIILEHSNLVVTPKVIQKVKSYLKMQH